MAWLWLLAPNSTANATSTAISAAPRAQAESSPDPAPDPNAAPLFILLAIAIYWVLPGPGSHHRGAPQRRLK
jgi:hypothetical protein